MIKQIIKTITITNFAIKYFIKGNLTTLPWTIFIQAYPEVAFFSTKVPKSVQRFCSVLKMRGHSFQVATLFPNGLLPLDVSGFQNFASLEQPSNGFLKQQKMSPRDYPHLCLKKGQNYLSDTCPLYLCRPNF